MTTEASAEQLPDKDVIGILLRQHSRIKELFAHVRGATGEHRQQTFDELRALLAAHETAEEMVLRPVSRTSVGVDVAEARNTEEKEANHVLANLEKLDVDSPEFDEMFLTFEKAVLAHAEHEELEEFPGVERGTSDEQLERMGKALLTAEATAPTHPHPGAAGSPVAQWTVGPFASLIDRARDAVTSVTSRS